MKKLVIGTHNGVFHSDEIIASALLVSFKGEASFIRSRDHKVLDSANILVDVGGKYDGVKNFDHHQLREGDALYGLSSAGMVTGAIKYGYTCNDCQASYETAINNPCCENCGSMALMSDRHLWEKQRRLVDAVDARDTRVNWNKDGEFEPLFNAVNDCNNIDIWSKAQDEMFEVLVAVFVEYFNTSISNSELLSKVSALGVKNKAGYDVKMNERFKNVSKIGMIGNIPMYATPKYEYVNTRQHFGDTPFVFVHLDTLDGNYGVTTNTNFCKIIGISNPINGMISGVHANGFFAKTTTLDGLEIKIEEV